ncbi:putative basic amino acid antiporter YfcC [Lentibacillus sp.]|uniref:putative basic amino acid antiporter YfcC n=1 Tax=Lentibacillus sp. TaxID=1925746 RepID=UPI002B4B481D|nr:putative basic amino acid antiporter YfcC [Lentibacillus sp.]HLS09019.1 putative basic amino acid antiporter YfcC [Lentibacillus sp.]
MNDSKNKTWRMPHTFVIVFFVIILTSLVTYIVPKGYFEVTEVEYEENGEMKTKEVLDPNTFHYDTNEAGETRPEGVKLFSTGEDTGFLNYVFEGLVSGDKNGSAVGVVAFIIVIGGAFGIVMHTTAIESGMMKLIQRMKGRESLIVPVLFIAFSLGGAIFGMGEEAIAFAMILAPVMVAIGFDAITAVFVTYVATQVGFGTSWMNPFSVAIAQGVSGVPVFSGAGLRMIIWAIFTLTGALFAWWYATKVRKDPQRSFSYHTDAYYRENKPKDDVEVSFKLGHSLVILTLFAGIIWVIWGVVEQGYYIPEIATQFFAIGLVSGIIGVIFKLNKMRINDIAESFSKGAKDLLPAALIVGMAKGILLLLGGDNANEASVLNTMLYTAGMAIGDLPQVLSAWFMYIFQSVFNFFVVSGSGQAALTMPIMAPLADIVGVTRQTAVLAFQLGDGFTNIMVPTSAALMGTLGAARVEWGSWIKFIWKFMLLLFIMASVVMIIAVFINY